MFVHIDADDLDIEEVIEALKNRGYVVSGGHCEGIGNRFEVEDAVERLRDSRCPEDILRQITEHFGFSLVSNELKELLKTACKV